MTPITMMPNNVLQPIARTDRAPAERRRSSSRMRLLLLIFAVLLGACSHKEQIALCGEHWWSCEHYDNEEQLANALKAKERRHLEIAKGLDIDFKACAAVLLADEITEQHITPPDRIYVSLFGQDPPPEVLTDLEKAKIFALPVSKIEPSSQEQSRYWRFSVSSIQKKWFGGYDANAGYHCGSLCAGDTEYQLKKEGNSCTVVSKGLRWVS